MRRTAFGNRKEHPENAEHRRRPDSFLLLSTTMRGMEPARLFALKGLQPPPGMEPEKLALKTYSEVPGVDRIAREKKKGASRRARISKEEALITQLDAERKAKQEALEAVSFAKQKQQRKEKRAEAKELDSQLEERHSFIRQQKGLVSDRKSHASSRSDSTSSPSASPTGQRVLSSRSQEGQRAKRSSAQTVKSFESFYSGTTSTWSNEELRAAEARGWTSPPPTRPTTSPAVQQAGKRRAKKSPASPPHSPRGFFGGWFAAKGPPPAGAATTPQVDSTPATTPFSWFNPFSKAAPERPIDLPAPRTPPVRLPRRDTGRSPSPVGAYGGGAWHFPNDSFSKGESFSKRLWGAPPAPAPIVI